MTILPISYLGSIEYFAHLVQGKRDCVIDIHEHYIKRSERNRAEIMTANGVLPLSVYLSRANRPCTPVCDVRIDYSKRWQHQHLVALRSAYAASPYFEMVMDSLARFYEREWQFLADYDLELTAELLRLIGTEPKIAVSESYVQATETDIDLRPKKRETTMVCPPYFQLFCDRIPFVGGLSIVDLLMSEGRSTLSFLERCQL